MRQLRKMTKRINVTLPDVVFEKLVNTANKQGRSIANLAAYLIEARLEEIEEKEQED